MPGLKPGQKHSGSFKPGHDPRRHLEGPRRSKRNFQELVRAHTEEAVNFLRATIDDEDAPYGERYKAAELLLAHAHGKPVDRQVVATMEGTAAGRPSLSALIAQVTPMLEGTPPSGLKSEGDVQVLPPDKFYNDSDLVEVDSSSDKFSDISDLVSDASRSGEVIYVEKANGDKEESTEESTEES